METARPTLKNVNHMNTLTEIENGMSHVFQDAQKTLSGHRKLAVVLRNIQTRAIALDYEESFNFHFTKLVSKVLKIRKGVPAADRIAKFVTSFVKKMIEDETEHPSRPVDDDDGVPTVFTEFLLRHLLRGTESKFKDVRYRITQFLAYLVHTVPEIDEDLYKALEYTLRRGLRDKEHVVRLQAVVAMSMFQIHGDGDQKPNHAVKAIINAMNHDESPEVRRAAMLTLTKNKHTIPEVLRRARDTNAINRRLVYGRVVSEIGGVRDIEVELRQNLLKWGLHDREVSVKQAAVNMFTKTWLTMADDKILSLLERLNVVDSDAAEPAMMEYFDQHQESLDKVEFTEQQWRELDSEKAFYIRTFLDYCHSHNLYNKLDKSLPELSVLASYLNDYLKLRMKLIQADRELLDNYTTYKTKLAKFDQHMLEKEADQADLMRRTSKNEKAIASGSSHIEGLIGSIKGIKHELSQLASKKSDMQKAGASTDNISEQILNLKNDLKDSQTELDELQGRLAKYQEYLKKDEDTLQKNAKGLEHLEEEKESFVESNAELADNFKAFGDQMKHLEFVIEQLLLVIKRSDFADIVGTRKLQPLISQALTNDRLPDKLIVLCVQILRQLSNDESYFSNLCIEIITDIRDSGMEENDQTFISAASLFGEEDGAADDDDDAESQSAEESSKRRKVAPALPSEDLLIQCLIVLQHYLELLEDSISSTHQFDSLIETLIRPAMCSSNWEVKRLGVRSLGLVSLLDNYLTLKNLRIFGQYASKSADEELRILAIQVVFDLLSTHGTGILGGDSEFAVDSLSLARLFHTMLREYDHPRVQAVVAEGLCKLFLADLMEDFGKDEEFEDGEEEMDYEGSLLRALLIAYFHPLNAQNEELKQILAFCVPVYAFSHSKHQAKISNVSGDCFYEMYNINSKFNAFEKVTAPNVVLQQFIHWSDPREIVNISEEDFKKNPTHLWQVMKFLEIVEQDSPKHIKKLIISNLPKLCLHKEIGAPLLRGLKEAITDTKKKLEANRNDPEFVLDAPTERILEKFRITVDELVKAAEADEMNDRTKFTPRSRSPSVPLSEINNSGSNLAPDAETSMSDKASKRAADSESVDANASEEEGEAEEDEEEKEKKKEQEKELAEIDQLLDEEENVDYDIHG